MHRATEFQVSSAIFFYLIKGILKLQKVLNPFTMCRGHPIPTPDQNKTLNLMLKEKTRVLVLSFRVCVTARSAVCNRVPVRQARAL